MPTEVFFRLSPEKRQAIIDAAIEEFGEKGYNNASTNRIVTKVGIAKGSLFQYFKTKDDLYFYLMDTAVRNIYAQMEQRMTPLPEDLLDRIEYFLGIKIEVFSKNLNIYRFMITLNDAESPGLLTRVLVALSPGIESIYGKAISGVRTDNLRVPVMTAFKTLMWISEGMMREYLLNRSEYSTVEKLMEAIGSRLKLVMNIMRKGMLER